MTADPKCGYCHGTGDMDSGGVTAWNEAIYVRCNCNVDPLDRIDQRLQSFSTKLNELMYEMELLKFSVRGLK